MWPTPAALELVRLILGSAIAAYLLWLWIRTFWRAARGARGARKGLGGFALLLAAVVLLVRWHDATLFEWRAYTILALAGGVLVTLPDRKKAS